MGKNVQLLVVEDDDGDFLLIERAFKKTRFAGNIVRATDGVDAFEILRGDNGRHRLNPPFFVLCDINMPRMDGLRFVEELRSDPDLHRTVVFMLTTSKHDEDKHKAYTLNVAGYLLKSDIDKELTHFVQLLGTYARFNQFA